MLLRLLHLNPGSLRVVFIHAVRLLPPLLLVVVRSFWLVVYFGDGLLDCQLRNSDVVVSGSYSLNWLGGNIRFDGNFDEEGVFNLFYKRTIGRVIWISRVTPLILHLHWYNIEIRRVMCPTRRRFLQILLILLLFLLLRRTDYFLDFVLLIYNEIGKSLSALQDLLFKSLLLLEGVVVIGRFAIGPTSRYLVIGV